MGLLGTVSLPQPPKTPLVYTRYVVIGFYDKHNGENFLVEPFYRRTFRFKLIHIIGYRNSSPITKGAKLTRNNYLFNIKIARLVHDYIADNQDNLFPNGI